MFFTKPRSLSRAHKAVLAASVSAAAMFASLPASAIVINDGFTPTNAIDPGVTGIGQMVIDQQNGFIGLCTATLINPRTVIFASHCVNENPDESAFMPASGYGSAFGGLPIGFFFNSNNNAAGDSAIGHWLNGLSGGPKYQTDTADNAYNSNYVVYDTDCCTIGLGNNFLQSDIALAALDTPAVGIPTWTLLFSPLTQPEHAEIVGYGDNGTGTTGQGTIDFRRRAAENIVSVLGSLDDQDKFLFGAPDGLPANLYMLDFNDPKFGTAQANAFDFNVFHDAATPREGITAPGDSGGPLIIDTAFDQPTIAAVLSGGDSFFNAQKGASYGTTSFYQPLYLYWDWIVANNPYKYVGNKAGNGNWTDPNHWAMNLDPAYMTVVDGQLVNGLPATAAQGQSNVDPGFGEICYFDDCINLATGDHTNPTPPPGPNPTGGTGGGADKVAISQLDLSADPATVAGGSVGDGHSILSSQDEATPPEGSAFVGGEGGETVQGAPGASGFVPEDTDGDPTTGKPARYYDVTIAADGTTTLSGANIVIDRLTINGANTGLTIAEGASLTSLIDTTVYAGNFTVNGIYASVGDIALMGGFLTGDGTIIADNTTAVLAGISAGDLESVGTLTFDGNLIASSASGLVVNSLNGTADRLVVNGTYDVGGTLMYVPMSKPHFGDDYVIATADDVEGGFDSVPDTITGVLYPVATVHGGEGGFVELSIAAGSFLDQLNGATPDQITLAGLLDQDRGQSGSMTDLYDEIDVLGGDDLKAALEGLAPDVQRTLPGSSQIQSESFTNALWSHLNHPQGVAGTASAMQIDAAGIQMALSKMSSPAAQGIASMGLNTAQALESGQPADVSPAQWVGFGNGLAGFLTGTTLTGSLDVGGGGGRASVDGFLFAGGLDFMPSDHFRLGLSLAMSQANTALHLQAAGSRSNGVQGALYGEYQFDDGLSVKGFAGGAIQSIATFRAAIVGPTVFRLSGHTKATTPTLGLSLGKDYNVGDSITLSPAVSLQSDQPHIDPYTETGGAPALSFGKLTQRSLQGRVGLDAFASYQISYNTVLKPLVSANLVHDFNGTAPIIAGFAGVPLNVGTFAGTTKDENWIELGAGFEADVGDNSTVSVRYDTTTSRKDLYYGAFTGSLRIRF